MAFKVVGIGEVLWDLLPSGPQLGGAPGNFAFHARQMGAEVRLVTRVGNDSYGRRIFQRFQQMGIDWATVQVDQKLATGTATVLLDNTGKPQFTINNNVAWDALSFTDEALDTVRTAHAVCFGTLAQRTAVAASTIQRLLSAAGPSSLKVLDLNLRQSFYSPQLIEKSLKNCNVLKLNDSELSVLSSILGLGGDVRRQIEELSHQYQLQLMALTRGQGGSLLYQKGTWSDSPGSQMQVVDTVGAGDAFTAALVLGMLNRFGLEDIHRIAVEIAEYVCSCPGGTPALPKHLCAAFASAGQT